MSDRQASNEQRPANEKVGKVRWIGNPLADIVRCFRKLYPHLSADISVQPVPPDLKGQCSFGGDDHPIPLVTIDPSLPYVGCIDILAHELAHVAAGEDGGHGPEWEKAYEAIHNEYHAFVERSAKRAGVEPVKVTVDE